MQAVIYIQLVCFPCKNTKDYLIEKVIDFEDESIREGESTPKEMMEKYNSNATPTILVGGKVTTSF